MILNKIIQVRDQGHDMRYVNRSMKPLYYEIQALFLHQNQLSCFHPSDDQYISAIIPCYLIYKYNNMVLYITQSLLRFIWVIEEQILNIFINGLSFK